MNQIKSSILLIFILIGCNPHEMKITIVNKRKTNKIPSGSGIVNSKGIYYVVGDDSPFLFELDKDFQMISKTRLVASNTSSNERMLKSIKPDFEAMEMIGENEIVVFGSGSKSPQRDVFIHVFLKDSIQVEKYDISGFYDTLRNLPILSDSELNIEAAAFYNNQIFLFNRRKNIVFKFNYKELLSHLKGVMPFPKPEISQYFLPQINGVEAGFSGATILKGESKIIFTASVENTNNAYDDGRILGSFIGMIDISNNGISESYEYCQIPNTDENLKVESVTIDSEISSGKTNVVLITDDDKGNSILLKGTLLW